MAIPEQFSLRWNDFHSNLSQGFHALLECEDLVDVTLAAGGQYVHAHKLILSVCSPYFKELFKMNPCEHPIVILKDVALSELRQLLQFMYKGEVHVRQQELSGFLQTAELLQVKGLTAGREKSESPPPIAKPQYEQFSSVKTEQCNDSNSGEWVPGGDETIAMESSAPSGTEQTNQDEDAGRSPLKRLLKNTPNKTNMNSNKKKSRPSNDNSYAHENIEYGSDGEPMLDFDSEMVYHSVLEMPEHNKDLVKIKQEGVMYHSVLDMSDHGKNSLLKIKQEGGWNCKTGGVKCPSCHRFFANRYNLKVHIRDKHDTLEGTLQCDICHKRMRNPSCLRVHMYHHRKQAAFLAAQLTSGQQMDPEQKNMIANMSGKWRPDGSLSTSPLTGAEYKEQERIANMSGKWHTDGSLSSSPLTTSEYKEQDSLIALAAGEDSSQPSGDSSENA